MLDYFFILSVFFLQSSLQMDHCMHLPLHDGVTPFTKTSNMQIDERSGVLILGVLMLMNDQVC